MRFSEAHFVSLLGYLAPYLLNAVPRYVRLKADAQESTYIHTTLESALLSRRKLLPRTKHQMNYPPSKYPPAHNLATALLSLEQDTQERQTTSVNPSKHHIISSKNDFA